MTTAFAHARAILFNMRGGAGVFRSSDTTVAARFGPLGWPTQISRRFNNTTKSSYLFFIEHPAVWSVGKVRVGVKGASGAVIEGGARLVAIEVNHRCR